jgi:Flp pilus assembly protein TadG
MARLRRDTSGNIAIFFALSAMGLVLMVGLAIDTNRYFSVRNQVQDALDAAALGAAASRSQTVKELEEVSAPYFQANLKVNQLIAGWTTSTQYVDGKVVRITFKGGVKPIFAGLAGVKQFDLNAAAEATRGVAQQVETVLVLDNTWSMSEKDSRSVKRIDALKSSASLLVNELMATESDEVSIGIVPYAEYVNVGMANREAPWISVPKDYKQPRTCTTKTTYSGGTPYPCTTVRDGVSETGTCYKDQVVKIVDVPPYQCDISYKWFGCVYSRNVGTTRLNDQSPATLYKGFLTTSQTCLNAVSPLSKSKSSVLNAIKNLVINVGGYKPETHIPSGLIWGINLLSPTAPFQEGGAYDPANRTPRKILVLMTDGVNTLSYRSSDGAHVKPAKASDLTQTDTDMTSICTYAKSNKIEVFTVGLNVPTQNGRNLLRICATDSDHAFLAEDSAALEAAFREIARSIGVVRLIK